MERESALFVGRKGYYAIAFYGGEGAIEAQASGPIPFEGVGWTSIVASATGKTRDEALSLVTRELEEAGF